jgi:hypothetical protein
LELFSAAGFKNLQARHILFTSKRTPDFLLPTFKTLDNVLEAAPAIKNLAAIIMVKGEKDAEG